MLKLFSYLLIISLMMGCNNNNAKYPKPSLKTTSLITEGNKIQNLLIIGGGNTVTRIFLDDVSNEISRTFSGANIQTTSIVLEKQEQLDTVNYDNYDAFLVFSNNNAKWSNKVRDKTWLSTPLEKRGLIRGYIPSLEPGSKMQGAFKLYLFQQMENRLGITWEGDLDVNLDMKKNKKYKAVAKLIYTELRKKKVIIN